MSAVERVERYLEEYRTKQRGLDPEVIHQMNLERLLVADLEELVAKARLADAVRVSVGVERGYFEDGHGIRPHILAPLGAMHAQNEGRAKKFERPRAISMVTQAPLGPWVEVDEWSNR